MCPNLKLFIVCIQQTSFQNVRKGAKIMYKFRQIPKKKEKKWFIEPTH